MNSKKRFVRPAVIQEVTILPERPVHIAAEDRTVLEYTCKFKTTRNGTATDSNATTFAVIDKIQEGRAAPFFSVKTCTVSVEE